MTPLIRVLGGGTFLDGAEVLVKIEDKVLTVEVFHDPEVVSEIVVTHKAEFEAGGRRVYESRKV